MAGSVSTLQDQPSPITSLKIILQSSGGSNYGSGGGIYVYSSAGTHIQSNKIHGNDAHINGLGTGGEIYIQSSGGNIVVSDNEIYNNENDSTSVYDHGGIGIAVSSNAGQVLIQQNMIHDNYGPNYWGTGIAVMGCDNSVVVERNQIINNQGSGAIQVITSIPIIQQNIIINPDNSAGFDHGVYFGGTGVIRNNIIADHEIYGININGYNGVYLASVLHNTISHTNYGVNIEGNATVTVDRCIISDQATGVGVAGGPNTSLTVSNTLFHANTSDGITGTNPLTGDPLYKDPENNDYHLLWGSAAIDRVTSGRDRQ